RQTFNRRTPQRTETVNFEIQPDAQKPLSLRKARRKGADGWLVSRYISIVYTSIGVLRCRRLKRRNYSRMAAARRFGCRANSDLRGPRSVFNRWVWGFYWSG